MELLRTIQDGEDNMKTSAETCSDIFNFVSDKDPDNKWEVFDAFPDRDLRTVVVILETMVEDKTLPRDFMKRKRNETKTKS
ncbi:hypothetical protein LCGC14_1959230 [marine sediment metagenome]|uniref:Uncharacterized protein n=1 Tax=marine sediment metagenome TaxID=412755 RepID=A0A0F9FFC2_9ZZZZ